MESLRKSKYIGLRIHSNFLKDNRSSSTAFNPARLVLKLLNNIYVVLFIKGRIILSV